MIISFDLDDTLIARNKFRLEKTSLFRQFFGIERLREGTIDLFKEIKKRKYKIYIYTTSHRSIWRIRWIFFSYGISVDFVINQQKHQKEIKRHNINCSKFPPMYNIDLHIDDSVGVEMEGKKYGFKTIIISEKDENWMETILNNLK
ncbi:HAD family hydrolase [Flavobacterium hibisci]|uniref:HAD family hydrolase n=1 Tax=Flavobacterium hibisci TaxID=1914462 RepID=UPI001CBF261C|nr:HAD family hydrolase [Flavobacterium hibisci]MBZ4044292.1 HAD family hydrolase [Flavobacterium hibisci]